MNHVDVRDDPLGDEIRAQIERLDERLEAGVQDLKLAIEEAFKQFKTSIIRSLIVLCVPMWVGFGAMIIALLVKF